MKFLLKEIDPDVSYIFFIKTREEVSKDRRERYEKEINVAMEPMVRSKGVTHEVITTRNYGTFDPSGAGEPPPIRLDKQTILFIFEEAEELITDHETAEGQVREHITKALDATYNREDLPGKLSYVLFYNASIEQILDIPSRQFYKTPEENRARIQEMYPNFDVIMGDHPWDYILLDRTPLSYTIGGDGISDY